MHKKLVHIIVEEPSFNLYNKFSAVASVIRSFAFLLEEYGFEVHVNNKKIVHSSEKVTTKGFVKINSKFAMFYRLFPVRAREFVKDLRYKKALKKELDYLNEISNGDLVINWVSKYAVSAVGISKKLGVPLVSIYDNPLNEEYEFMYGFKSFFWKEIRKKEKYVLENSDSIIAYSRAVSKHVSDFIQTPKPFLYKAFVDFDRMPFKAVKRNTDQLRLVFIGSFFNWHNIPKLMDAFATFIENHKDSILFLVGDGPEMANIRKMVDALGISDKVVFTGRLDGNELKSILKDVNVAVIPHALWFQAPVKLFQYMSSSLAVLAYDTPTIQELTKNAESVFYFKSKADLVKLLNMVYLKRSELSFLGEKSVEFSQSNFGKSSFDALVKKLPL